jgi:hypothetical protein
MRFFSKKKNPLKKNNFQILFISTNNKDIVRFIVKKIPGVSTIFAVYSYLYIKAAKSFFNVPREKLSPRPLAAEARQSRGC